MPDRWYYTHDGQKIGPCSGQQLKDFASCGRILPTDTVWKEGIEKGSLAQKVRYLFSPTLVDAPPGTPPEKSAVQQPATLPAVQKPTTVVQPKPNGTQNGMGSSVKPEAAPTEAGTVQSVLVPLVVGTELPPDKKPPAMPNQVRKKRAVGGKGVMIIGQDGINVKYRKKCTACGHEDSSWNSMPIPTGSARVSFFCPKCRKKRDGEIQGYSS